jgi:hypothetical protein
VIFDVDGVLVASPHELAWRETLRELMETSTPGCGRLRRGAPGRPLWTTREPAARAPADDRNRGRKRAQTGGRRQRLVIVLSVPERTPPPPRRPSGHALRMRGRRAADAARHATPRQRAARYRRPREAAWSSSTSSQRPVERGATTRSPCLLHGLLPASVRGPRHLRHARRPARYRGGEGSTDASACRRGQAFGALGQTLACRPRLSRKWVAASPGVHERGVAIARGPKPGSRGSGPRNAGRRQRG